MGKHLLKDVTWIGKALYNGLDIMYNLDGFNLCIVFISKEELQLWIINLEKTFAKGDRPCPCLVAVIFAD